MAGSAVGVAILNNDSRTDGSPGTLCILIVDDDPTVTQTFARILRLNGYEALTAHDAQSALEVIEANRPDAVIVDLHMPATDGLTFVRQVRVRAGEPYMPIAMITGDYFLGDDVTGELREFDVLVYFKPLWLEDLLRVVEQLVRKRSQRPA